MKDDLLLEDASFALMPELNRELAMLSGETVNERWINNIQDFEVTGSRRTAKQVGRTVPPCKRYLGSTNLKPRLCLYQEYDGRYGRSQNPEYKKIHNKKTEERDAFRNLAGKMANIVKSIAKPSKTCSDTHSPPECGATPYLTGADIIRELQSCFYLFNRRIDQIHIFSHSAGYGLFSAHEGGCGLYINAPTGVEYAKGGRIIKDIPWQTLSHNVLIVLYGCNTARDLPPAWKAEHFTKQLFDWLSSKRLQATVLGHTAGEGVSFNCCWKEYSQKTPLGVKYECLRFKGQEIPFGLASSAACRQLPKFGPLDSYTMWLKKKQEKR